MRDFFYELTPERVLDAVEALGFRCTGRCLALNSYENRVYEVELEEEPGEETMPHAIQRRRVVKFYRPGRWSREQILEEHRFLLDLEENEIPVIAPCRFPDGGTLHLTGEGGIWCAVFPKVGGRIPDEMDAERLEWVGRLLARIHNVGASRPALHRLRLNVETYGSANLEFLLENDWVPENFRHRYEEAAREIFRIAAPAFASSPSFRIHGDCHCNNLLWGNSGPFFLDFDDMVTGPPVQDIWLLVPGRDAEAADNLESLLCGYEEMRTFDRSSLRLVEVLRSLRYIHFTAWMARRFEDPAFPRAFPYFNTPKYWEDQTRDLMEQRDRLAAQLA